MSASPHPPMTSPPAHYSPAANGAALPPSPSNAQLATLLSASYRESESLKAELAATRKRLENSDRLLAALQQTDQANGSYSRIIADFERRVDSAERDRDATESRIRLFAEAWRDIEHYLVAVEARMSDARASFSRVVAEGRALLLPQELPQAPRFPPSSSGVSLNSQGTFYEGHRHTRSSGTVLSPSMAHPPPYGASRRPRANSIDDPHLAPSQPPLKRPRNDRDYERSTLHHPRRAPHDDQPHGRSGHAHPALRGAPSATPGIPAGPGVPPSAPRGRSRSRSRTSDGSMSVDDMLIEATMTNKDDTEHKFWSRQGGAPDSGPLPQPGQLGSYQTHVFVTDAPLQAKKSKHPPGSSGQPTLETLPSSASLAQIPTAPPSVTVSAPLADIAEPRTGSTFPGTNAQGQRICRQCGLPGRYKDGKCVEKWGPGPEGPGTVCDRCRKKMKRVERRGTLESQQQQLAAQQAQTLPPHHPSARPPHPLHAQVSAPPSIDRERERERAIARSDTMPVSHGPGGGGGGGGIGPGGTQLLSSAPGPYDRDRSREQTRSRLEHLRREDEHSRERERERDRERSRDSREAGGPRPGSAASGAGSGSGSARRTPPSPPAIATLQPHADADGEDENENENDDSVDEKPPRESHVRSTSARDSPHVGPGVAPHGSKRPSPQLSSRSADADGDAEGDADADDDILAAVDAAEQSHALKGEDMIEE